MKICRKCGGENREAAQFCRFCGNPYAFNVLVTDDSALPETQEHNPHVEPGLAVDPDMLPGAPFQDDAAEPQATPSVDLLDEPALQQEVGVGPQPSMGLDLQSVDDILEKAGDDSDPGETVRLPAGWQNTLANEAAEDQMGNDAPEDHDVFANAPVQTVLEELPVTGEEPDAAPDMLVTVVDEPAEITVEERRPNEADALDAVALEPAGADEMPESEPAVDPAELEEAPATVDIGTVLQGRYRVVEIVINDDGENIYHAEDLQACWSCQTVLSEPGLRFCEMCGAELSHWPVVHLYARPEDDTDQAPENRDEMAPAGIMHDDIRYSVETPELEAPDDQTAPILRYHSGFFSDKGMERDINEDSLLALQLDGLCETANAPLLGLFAVADGMGGHAAGEVASRTAIQALAASVMESIFAPISLSVSPDLDELDEKLQKAVLAANQAILDSRGQADMGCTLTVALLVDGHAIIANAGDSRTYHMRNGVLTQITRDHSKIARMVEQNLLEPDALYNHPEKGVVYRCLGDKPNLEVETTRLDIELGDRLLLCSDGLWDMVRDPFIEDALLEQFEPQQAAERLVDMANLSGGEDNISVIVVDIRSLG